MMADTMKMLANLTMQNQQLYSSRPQVQQTTVGYSRCWRPEMVAAYKSPVALKIDALSIAVVPS